MDSLCPNLGLFEADHGWLTSQAAPAIVVMAFMCVWAAKQSRLTRQHLVSMRICMNHELTETFETFKIFDAVA